MCGTYYFTKHEMGKWKIYVYIVVLTNFILTDRVLSFKDAALKYTGRFQEHEVTTEDGYILKLFHIPGVKNRPVLLAHGLLDTADVFILRGETSLAVSLSRAGYDVWIGNFRGNRYSRRHVTLVPDKHPHFWNFTFHEYGTDIASFIDYILLNTGHNFVKLISVSQGSAALLALASTRPKYNRKIEVFVALGPVAFNRGLRFRVSDHILKFNDILNLNFETTDVELREVAGYYSLAAALIEWFCTQRVFHWLCLNTMSFPVFGFDPIEFEHSIGPKIFSNIATGTSRKNLKHSQQLMESGNFQQYDHGPKRNKIVYGTTDPPLYNLTEITMDTYLLSAKNDDVSTPQNVALLQRSLPNCKRNYVMKSASFSHIGFLLGKEGHKETFKYITEIFEHYP